MKAPGEGPGSLVLKRLDLLGARPLEPGPGDGERGPVEVPAMSVAVDRLHRGDLELGSLSFQLASEGPTLTASALTGEIAGLELDPGLDAALVDVSPVAALRVP